MKKIYTCAVKMTPGILKISKKFLRLFRKTLPKGLPKVLFVTSESLEVKVYNF